MKLTRASGRKVLNSRMFRSAVSVVLTLRRLKFSIPVTVLVLVELMVLLTSREAGIVLEVTVRLLVGVLVTAWWVTKVR